MTLTRPLPGLLGACAVALVTGCAQFGPVASGDDKVGADARPVTARPAEPATQATQATQATLRVEPVYRFSQRPAGTAAGQFAAGRVDLVEGRVHSAIQRFRNALELDPDFRDAYNGLGIAFGQIGRFDESARAFQAALAGGPPKAHLLSNLGYAQYRAGQYDDAWSSLRQSYELEPRNDKTRENLKLVADAILARKGGGSRSAAEVMPTPLVAQALVPQPGSPASAFEVTVSGTPGSALIQVAPNVYELRAPAAAPMAAVEGVAPVARSAIVPSALASPSYSTQADVAVEPVPVRRVQVVATLPDEAPQARPLRVTALPSAQRLSPPVRAMRPVAETAAALDGLEVSNGVGLPSLAGRTARQLRRHGVDVSRVSDYRNFGVARTEIHFRAGHEARARALQARLPVEAKLVRASNLLAGINVRLVVGRDMVSGPVAWWQEEADAPDVAVIEAPPMVELSLESASMALASPAAGGWRYL